MATQAQILANRRNAAKSTGPKTPEGKAAVAENATKHGLFSRYDVVISENQVDFDGFRDDMLAELAPEGTIETVLAGRIVSLTWRLKRTERMQNEFIDVKIRKEINASSPELSESLITGKPCDKAKYSDKCYDDQALGYIAMWDFAGSRALERLSMYERRLEASLFRTMAELKKLRDARRREQGGAGQTEAATYRGQACPERSRGNARETQGRDALATECETQGRDALATQCAKQSQSVGPALSASESPDGSAADQEELSAFEKREYELLLGAAPTPDKANDPQQKTQDAGQNAENSLQRKVMVCRY